jgi:tRNA-splicing ligase RtcB
MKILDGIPVFGEADDNTLKQMRNCMSEHATAGALMADNHLGYSQPIGAAVAYPEHISPSGVGYDIACGNKAVMLDIDYIRIRDYIPEIMDEIFEKISFGMGRFNPSADEVDISDDIMNHDAWNLEVCRDFKQRALQQLGTVGGGNHYVDVFKDELGRVWVGVHFGSRGLGHKIATHYIKAGGGSNDMMAAPVLLHQDSELGKEYLSAMDLAGKYAYAGRDWVCSKVSEIINAKILIEVHNHHNYAWKEHLKIDDMYAGDHWVVRKGCTPNYTDRCSFIGGNMADISVITIGNKKFNPVEYDATIGSTVHGAGRVMSRSQAAGRTRFKNGERIRVKEGEISTEMMMTKVLDAGVELRGADVDESPQCYKCIRDVLGQHKTTTTVVHTLTPVGVAMAGPEVRDPYKD